MTKTRSILIWILGVAGFCCVSSAAEVESVTALGLELSGPALTFRRVTEKYSLIVDAGFRVSGYYFDKSNDNTSEDRWRGTAGMSEADVLARYHLIRIANCLNFHLTAGTDIDWKYFLGTGLSFYKELEDKLFVFLDTDFSYAGANWSLTYVSWRWFDSQRIRFGFLKGF